MAVGIDLEKVERELAQTSLSDIVHGQPLLETIVEFLCDAAPAETTGVEPIQARRLRNDVSVKRFGPLIVDVVGPLSTTEENLTLGSSFLVGRRPKLYIFPYILLSRGLDAALTIWLDDVIARLKYARTKDEQAERNDEYEAALNLPDVDIVFSSRYFNNKIVPVWLLDKFKAMTWDDFIHVMPFDKRRPDYVRILDVLHLLWQATVLSQCGHDYFLTAINTKPQMTLVRKLCGAKRRILFLPKLPLFQGVSTTYGFGDARRVFDGVNDEAIDILYAYYKFATGDRQDGEGVRKRDLLNSYYQRMLVGGG